MTVRVGYGTLEYSFWEDPDLQELGLETRAVAAYLLTSRHASTEGYYRLSLAYICDDLRITREDARSHLQALDLKDFARYDPSSQVIFIRNALGYHPVRGAKTVAGALRRAREVPMNPFRSLFYEAAQHYAPEFAAALSEAGFASISTPPSQASLFKAAPTAAPTPGPAASEPDPVLAIMQAAARLSVQQSMARGEAIRSAEAVACSRLAQHRPQWTPLVTTWLECFTATPSDMAKALVDGGRASPYWARRTVDAG